MVTKTKNSRKCYFVFSMFRDVLTSVNEQFKTAVRLTTVSDEIYDTGN
jgi:hypothetical protein